MLVIEDSLKGFTLRYSLYAHSYRSYRNLIVLHKKVDALHSPGGLQRQSISRAIHVPFSRSVVFSDLFLPIKFSIFIGQESKSLFCFFTDDKASRPWTEADLASTRHNETSCRGSYGNSHLVAVHC